VKIKEVIAEGIWNTIKDKAGKATNYTAGGVGNYAKGWGQVGNMLAKDLVGNDPNQAWLSKNRNTDAPRYNYGDSNKPDLQTQLFQVRTPNGQVYFKDYTDRWFHKVSTDPTDYSKTHPLERFEDTEVLEKLLLEPHKIITVKQDPRGDNKFTGIGSVVDRNGIADINATAVNRKVSKKRGKK
jgi:hypothetical protein